MTNYCPLCKVRVSNWMMACDKTQIINGEIYHKSCLIDHELRTGRKLGAENGHDHTAGWTVGVRLDHPKSS